MPLAGSFTVDPQRVVHETIDGEAILIDLETGTYYSLAGAGAEIWDLLVAGWSAEEVVRELEGRYEADPSLIERTTHELVRDLCREGLLERHEANGNGALARAAVEAGAPASGEFATPVLQKYTDMQYFLLLDPVHEVEAAGWPHAKESVDSGDGDGAAGRLEPAAGP